MSLWAEAVNPAMQSDRLNVNDLYPFNLHFPSGRSLGRCLRSEWRRVRTGRREEVIKIKKECPERTETKRDERWFCGVYTKWRRREDNNNNYRMRYKEGTSRSDLDDDVNLRSARLIINVVCFKVTTEMSPGLRLEIIFFTVMFYIRCGLGSLLISLNVLLLNVVWFSRCPFVCY